MSATAQGLERWATPKVSVMASGSEATGFNKIPVGIEFLIFDDETGDDENGPS